MAKIKILKSFVENNEKIDQLDFESDPEGKRPAWIHIKDPNFKARFLTIRTETESEILYKRFTGNFYYPVDLKISKEEEGRFYQKYAQYYDEYTGKNNQPMAQFLLDKMLGLNIPKNAKILDLGAGTGIFSDLASLSGFTDLTLLDSSKAMLEVARNKLSLKEAKVILGDVRNQEFDEKYDLMVSVMMLDSINDKDLPETLTNLTKALNSNGYFFLIEDKARKEYKEFFNKIEDGVFFVSKERDFAKYYFIGQNKG